MRYVILSIKRLFIDWLIVIIIIIIFIMNGFIFIFLPLVDMFPREFKN